VLEVSNAEVTNIVPAWTQALALPHQCAVAGTIGHNWINALGWPAPLCTRQSA
jgi:hypothetical protein